MDVSLFSTQNEQQAHMVETTWAATDFLKTNEALYNRNPSLWFKRLFAILHPDKHRVQQMKSMFRELHELRNETFDSYIELCEAIETLIRNSLLVRPRFSELYDQVKTHGERRKIITFRSILEQCDIGYDFRDANNVKFIIQKRNTNEKCEIHLIVDDIRSQVRSIQNNIPQLLIKDHLLFQLFLENVLVYIERQVQHRPNRPNRPNKREICRQIHSYKDHFIPP